MDLKATAEFITQLRKENNMTQKQLAQKLNVTDKAVSRWETGRGYPDVESLLAISELFSVSVNEILCGKRIGKNEIETVAEKNIVDAFAETAVVRRKSKNRIAILSIVISIFLVLTVLGIFIFFNYCQVILGDPNCVIAADYSSIDYYGEKYIPLQTGEYSYNPGVILVREARVEDSGVLDKLFFGDTVYSVQGCPLDELLYLSTDYDDLTTECYCLESRYDYYRKLLSQAVPKRYYIGDDFNFRKTELDDSTAEMLFSLDETDRSDTVDCNFSRGNNDESIEVNAFEDKGIFCIGRGQILRKSGEYYWFDYDDVPPEQDNGDYSGIKAYVIDDSYDEIMDKYFSYTLS